MTKFPIDGTGRLASEREHPTADLVGPAGGDLAGNYPNPTVATTSGHAILSSEAPTSTGGVAEVSLLDPRFGVPTDGVTDCHDAIANMIDTLGPGDSGSPNGITIRVPVPAGFYYYLSKPLHLNRSIVLEGESPAAYGGGPLFRFKAGCHGFVFESNYQKGYFGGAAEFAQIRNIGVYPDAPASPRQITDGSIVAGSTTLTSATASFTSGDLGMGLTEDCLYPGDGLQPGTSIASVTNGTTVEMDKPAMGTGTTLPVWIRAGCAFAMGAHAILEDIQILGSYGGFGGHGVCVNAAIPYCNANAFQLTRVWVDHAGLDCFHVKGHDANAGQLSNCVAGVAGTVDATNGAAFRDDSILGNTYLMCQAAGGSNWGFQMGVNVGTPYSASTLVGCYCETGQGREYGATVTVLGGQNMMPNDRSAGSSAGIYQGRIVEALYPGAAPSTGVWVAGDRVFNISPTPGGYIGWVCTTGGSPGTWKGFGLIEA